MGILVVILNCVTFVVFCFFALKYGWLKLKEVYSHVMSLQFVSESGTVFITLVFSCFPDNSLCAVDLRKAFAEVAKLEEWDHPDRASSTSFY